MATNPRFGYALSSEEHRPRDLVANAQRAEAAGFDFAMLSDHFHPWTDRQGQSPFAWSVLGGIAAATERITVGTGVTALSIRIHPAILAQAAATVGDMLPGRFWFGVGTGENLNEHILGDAWPEHAMRAAMLEEAVELIRRLWTGELIDHDGDFYRVSRARLYTLPEALPPILIAAGGEESARVAGRIGDGLITTAPDKQLLKAYGAKGPKLGQVTISWAKDEKRARKTPSPSRSRAGRTRRSMSRRSSRTSKLASTTSTSTRSGRTRRASSGSPRRSCCRACAAAVRKRGKRHDRATRTRSRRQ
jgi:G6PDH family F420-dependent oxidoreductase